MPTAHPPTASVEKSSKSTRQSRSSKVISFRLKNEEVERLKKSLPDLCIESHLLARKIVRDFIDGRLVYLNRQDRLSSRIAS